MAARGPDNPTTGSREPFYTLGSRGHEEHPSGPGSRKGSPDLQELSPSSDEPPGGLGNALGLC